MDELDILALSNLSLPQADRAGELNALARKEKLAREMTHHPYQNPYGGLAENLAVGVYESPGNTAALLDFLASQSLPGRVTQLLSPTNTTLKGLTDQSAGLEGVMAGYHPESYTASPALQGLARLTGNIAGDPLEALPLGWVAGRGAKGLANAALSPKSPIHDQLGAIVFHGSPHKFNRFSHKFMGSGEGAQAYGWGTYLADRPGVANSYRSMLSGQKWTALDGKVMDDTQAGYEIAADIVEQFPDDFDSYYNATPIAHSAMEHRVRGMSYEDALELAGDDKARRIAVDGAYKKFTDFDAGNLYEVDLPDEHIEKMLDWDAPLSEQPDGVRKVVDEITKDWSENYKLGRLGENPDGQKIVRELGLSGQKELSMRLNAAGIPGIKYWDGGSRAAGDGTRNYVVFDENLMTVLKRNNEPLLPMDEASRMARAREMGFGDDLYHATIADIKEFSPEKFGSSTGARDARLGVWLTDDPHSTDYWMGFDPEMPTEKGMEQIVASNKIHREMNDVMSKALEDWKSDKIDGDGYFDRTNKIRAKYEPELRKTRRVETAPGYESGANVLPVKVRGEIKDVEHYGVYNDQEFSRIAREAADEGYDGVRFIGVKDLGESPRRHNQILIFDPKNIRSKFAKFDPAKKNSANLLAGTAAGAIGLKGLLEDHGN